MKGGYLAIGVDCVFGTRSDPNDGDVVRFPCQLQAEYAVKFWQWWNELDAADAVPAPPLAEPPEADAAKTLDADCGEPTADTLRQALTSHGIQVADGHHRRVRG